MALVNEGNLAGAATEFETYLKLAPTGPNAATAKGIRRRARRSRCSTPPRSGPGWPPFASASRAPPTAPDAIPPPSASIAVSKTFPPSTSAPPPTPARSISARTRSRKRCEDGSARRSAAALAPDRPSAVEQGEEGRRRFDVIHVGRQRRAGATSSTRPPLAAGRRIELLVQVDLAGEADQARRARGRARGHLRGRATRAGRCRLVGLMLAAAGGRRSGGRRGPISARCGELRDGCWHAAWTPSMLQRAVHGHEPRFRGRGRRRRDAGAGRHGDFRRAGRYA